MILFPREPYPLFGIPLWIAYYLLRNKSFVHKKIQFNSNFYSTEQLNRKPLKSAERSIFFVVRFFEEWPNCKSSNNYRQNNQIKLNFDENPDGFVRCHDYDNRIRPVPNCISERTKQRKNTWITVNSDKMYEKLMSLSTSITIYIVQTEIKCSIRIKVSNEMNDKTT